MPDKNPHTTATAAWLGIPLMIAAAISAIMLTWNGSQIVTEHAQHLEKYGMIAVIFTIQGAWFITSIIGLRLIGVRGALLIIVILLDTVALVTPFQLAANNAHVNSVVFSANVEMLKTAQQDVIEHSGFSNKEIVDSARLKIPGLIADKSILDSEIAAQREAYAKCPTDWYTNCKNPIADKITQAKDELYSIQRELRQIEEAERGYEAYQGKVTALRDIQSNVSQQEAAPTGKYPYISGLAQIIGVDDTTLLYTVAILLALVVEGLFGLGAAIWNSRNPAPKAPKKSIAQILLQVQQAVGGDNEYSDIVAEGAICAMRGGKHTDCNYPPGKGRRAFMLGYETYVRKFGFPEENQQQQEATLSNAGQQVESYPAPKNKQFTARFGVDNNGHEVVANLQFPHLLVAGTSGMGKSNFLNLLITQLISSHNPQQLNMLMFDMKGGVELGEYEKIPHLLRPVAETIDGCIELLQWLVAEREKRQQQIKSAGFKKLEDWQQSDPQNAIPTLFVVFDEIVAMVQKDKSTVFPALLDILSLGRSAGIHCILATQYPKDSVLPSSLTSQCDGRIAFRLKNQAQSKVVLDRSGAENLHNVGECIFAHGKYEPVIQTPECTHREVKQVVSDVISRYGAPSFDDSDDVRPPTGGNDLSQGDDNIIPFHKLSESQQLQIAADAYNDFLYVPSNRDWAGKMLKLGYKVDQSWLSKNGNRQRVMAKIERNKAGDFELYGKIG